MFEKRNASEQPALLSLKEIAMRYIIKSDIPRDVLDNTTLQDDIDFMLSDNYVLSIDFNQLTPYGTMAMTNIEKLEESEEDWVTSEDEEKDEVYQSAMKLMRNTKFIDEVL